MAVLDACSDRSILVWLDGGWGVDALLGEQGRPHDDVDVVVPLDQLTDLISWQRAAAPDGSDCEYPTTGFTTGVINGRVVGCLAPEVQLAHHLGYEPRSHDHLDMKRLATKYRLPLPPPYAP